MAELYLKEASLAVIDLLLNHFDYKEIIGPYLQYSLKCNLKTVKHLISKSVEKGLEISLTLVKHLFSHKHDNYIELADYLIEYSIDQYKEMHLKIDFKKINDESK